MKACCPSCNHEFEIKEQRKRKNPKQFYNCETCGKEFSQCPSRNHRFCSRTCWLWNARNIKVKTHNGYVRIYVGQDYPNADKRGRIMEHRKVMQDILGRPLELGELIHHKNGIRNDNRPENLELVSATLNTAYSYIDGRRIA